MNQAGFKFCKNYLVQGNFAVHAQHEYLNWELHESGGKQAVRMGNWKGVRVGISNDRNAPIGLYNLASDLQEKNNIAAQHSQIVTKLKKLIQQAYVPSAGRPLLAGE